MLTALRGDIQKHVTSFGKPHEDDETDEPLDNGDVSMYAQELGQEIAENRQRK